MSEQTQDRRWRKKPVVIEAVQWTGDNWSEIAAFHRGDHFITTSRPDGLSDLHVLTLEGVMVASPGDWIIRGVKGELYPCKPDIFAMTYEPVAAAAPSGEAVTRVEHDNV